MPSKDSQKGKKSSKTDSPQTKKRDLETPRLTQRDPSLSTVLPGPLNTHRSPKPSSSRPFRFDHESAPSDEPPRMRCWKKIGLFLYDPKEKTFCKRPCHSWGKLLGYAIMYTMFLATYFMIFLYFSLLILKTTRPNNAPRSQLFVYSNTIGITATPSSEHSTPLIWFRRGNSEDVKKYTRSIDELLLSHRRDSKVDIVTKLGPCGKSPYGYGDKPCVLVRINKRYQWAAKPLTENSTNAKEAPDMVQKWIKSDKAKYWLYCDGVHSYDREHLRKIQYYPDPPGFDAGTFPLELSARSPLIGVQFSEYTEGVSLDIQCKLWYDGGNSAVSFVLYVAPKNSLNLLRTNSTL